MSGSQLLFLQDDEPRDQTQNASLLILLGIGKNIQLIIKKCNMKNSLEKKYF